MMRAVLFLLAGGLAATALAGCTGGYQADVAPPPLVVHHATYHGPWAPVKTARIRPGAEAFVPGGQCTTNFLFRTPDNATLYMGLAAHCFGEEAGKTLPRGTAIAIGGVQDAGRLAYNPWEQVMADDNDFALVALSNTPYIRGQVNPSVLHFGGPVGLKASSAVQLGDKVVTYGHSSLRQPQDPDNPREGYVVQKEQFRIQFVTDHPGIPGDSGSEVMTKDGQAVAVLTQKLQSLTGGAVDQKQEPTVNIAVDLDHVLDNARHADPKLADLELVTSNDYVGPDLPA